MNHKTFLKCVTCKSMNNDSTCHALSQYRMKMITLENVIDSLTLVILRHVKQNRRAGKLNSLGYVRENIVEIIAYCWKKSYLKIANKKSNKNLLPKRSRSK